MNIGISGSSGQLGSAVLAELRERGSGHHVVGISRSPEKVQAPAEGRRGDYDQPETLAEAYKGLDRLLIIPSAEMRPGVRGRQYKAAIDAALAAGVKQVVLMSAAGTREAAEPSLGAEYWTGKQPLSKTAPRWTILRMNYYAEALAEEVRTLLGVGALTGLGEGRVALVARNGVAAAAAGILVGEATPGRSTTPPAARR